MCVLLWMLKVGVFSFRFRSFIEESHAGIKISPQDNNYAGLHDRLVTVTGTFDNQMNAIDLILKKLSEDVHYPPNLSSPFPYAGKILAFLATWCYHMLTGCLFENIFHVLHMHFMLGDSTPFLKKHMWACWCIDIWDLQYHLPGRGADEILILSLSHNFLFLISFFQIFQVLLFQAILVFLLVIWFHRCHTIMLWTMDLMGMEEGTKTTRLVFSLFCSGYCRASHSCGFIL